MRQATTYATRAAADAARFAHVGGNGRLRNPSVLQRCFRDIHAGTQHIYVDNNTLTGYTQALVAHTARRVTTPSPPPTASGVRRRQASRPVPRDGPAFNVGRSCRIADSSVVVLAPPDLYSTFDVSIVGVSWTITAYNVAIVIGALAVLPLEQRLRGHVIAATGLGLRRRACAAGWRTRSRR